MINNYYNNSNILLINSFFGYCTEISDISKRKTGTEFNLLKVKSQKIKYYIRLLVRPMVADTTRWDSRSLEEGYLSIIKEQEKRLKTLQGRYEMRSATSLGQAIIALEFNSNSTCCEPFRKRPTDSSKSRRTRKTSTSRLFVFPARKSTQRPALKHLGILQLRRPLR